MAERPRITWRHPDYSTVMWIRNYLVMHGEGYAWGMWKEFCEDLKGAGYEKIPKYSSFARYLWTLKELGLIEPWRRRAPESGFSRVYYRIAPGKEDISYWMKEGWVINPQAELAIRKRWVVYDPLLERYVPAPRLGKRRYARRVLGKPPKPRGRPRKSP